MLYIKPLMTIAREHMANDGFKVLLKKLTYQAVRSSNYGCLKLFLEFGADPNPIGARKITPVYIAIYNNFIPGVKLLVEFGAKLPNLENAPINSKYAYDQLSRILNSSKEPQRLEYLSIAAVRRTPNYESRMQCLPKLIQKEVLIS